jgi:hypothetical protein
MSHLMSTSLGGASSSLIRHPVYGGALETGFRPIPGYPRYTINEHCHVMGPRGEILKHDKNYRVMLHKDKAYEKKTIYRLSLLAFYPNIPPLDSVDHIDGNYHNNHIINLQWMTLKDNIRKSKIGVPNTNGPTQSKTIWLLDGREGARVTRYKNRQSAAIGVKAVSGLVVDQGLISHSARSGGRLAAKGYFFMYEEQPDLPGEEWRTSATLDRVLNQVDKPDDKKVKVSSFGRIRNANGIKKRGSKAKRASSGVYRKTKVNGVLYADHQLIFMGWNDKSAPGPDERDVNGNRLVICHDDAAPKDESNCYRNWPIDLKIGTQKENMQSYHEEKRRQKRKREEIDDRVDGY